MHFVFGGAFHGKKRWVIDFFQVNQDKRYFWFNANSEAKNFQNVILQLEDHNIVVIEGIEKVIQEIVDNDKKNNPLHSFLEWLTPILNWEAEKDNRQLVIIGTDSTKGIVPIAKQERLLRDEVGRCFQAISSMSKDVSLIWYGLSQSLKTGGVYK